jgi:hypothetical protein
MVKGSESGVCRPVQILVPPIEICQTSAKAYWSLFGLTSVLQRPFVLHLENVYSPEFQYAWNASERQRALSNSRISPDNKVAAVFGSKKLAYGVKNICAPYESLELVDKKCVQTISVGIETQLGREGIVFAPSKYLIFSRSFGLRFHRKKFSFFGQALALINSRGEKSRG